MKLLKNLFKKGKVEERTVAGIQGAQMFDPAPTAAPAAKVSASDTEKKDKHGEPGICCGSCH